METFSPNPHLPGRIYEALRNDAVSVAEIASMPELRPEDLRLAEAELRRPLERGEAYDLLDAVRACARTPAF